MRWSYSSLVLVIGCGGIVSPMDVGLDAGADGAPSHPGVELPAACPALRSCGGALAGTWDYRGACIDNALGKLKGGCASATIEDPSGAVKGSVTFMGGRTVHRTLTALVTATVVLPPACTGGASCSDVQARLPPGATCTGSAGTCRCRLTNEDSISDSDTYAVSGSTLVTGGGGQYDFCVSGDTLRYADRGTQPQYHGTFELTRR